MKKLGLYIHLPFCTQKCGYCDFYSANHSEATMDNYLAALLANLNEYAQNQLSQYEVDTIYLGGGTPPRFGQDRLTELLEEIHATLKVTRDCEITSELNPGSVDRAILKAMKSAGINRLSIGVQSCSDAELSQLGRAHTATESEACINAARDVGFDNFSLDLMYGIPNQTLKSWLTTLEKTTTLGATHLSLYGLKIEEGTPFAVRRNQLELPDEDTERAMYLEAIDLLSGEGYSQYEISNFAKKGCQCRHNLKYWNCDEYLGLGPSAHSYLGGARFSYKKDINLYIDSFLTGRLTAEGEPPLKASAIYDDYFEVPPVTRLNEYVMLRLRLNEGIDLNLFQELFKSAFEPMFLSSLKPFLDSGHAVRTPTGYALTPEGMLVSNYILARVITF